MVELIDGKYYTSLLVMKAMQKYVPTLMLSNEKEMQKFTGSITTERKKCI